MTRSWNDEGLAKIVGAGGMEGLARYGLWWRVLEIIGEQMSSENSKCSVTYPVARWSLLLSLRGSLVFSTLSTLTVSRGATVSRDGDEITVTVPNLLKYRDEYTKKSVVSHDNVPPRTETDKDTDTEPKKDQKKASAQSVPPEKLAGTLPLVDGTEYEVSKDQVSDWQNAFPGVDVRLELKQFKEWLKANPKRKKTRSGITRAIFNWLSKAQNQSRGDKKNAKVPDGVGPKIMGVLQDSFFGSEHQDSAGEDGYLPAGWEGRQNLA